MEGSSKGKESCCGNTAKPRIISAVLAPWIDEDKEENRKKIIVLGEVVSAYTVKSLGLAGVDC